jgi:hypothetical protein
MSRLARPGPFAALLTLIALALHPALRLQAWPRVQSLVVAVLVGAAALALVSRAAAAVASRRLADLLVAAGGLALIAALATDGVKGHHGVLALGPGQMTANFEERGLDGKPLGLPPRGFPVEALRAGSDGRAMIAFSGRAGTLELVPGRALAFAGYRFARPRTAATGGVARLRVGVADGHKEEVVDLAPGRPGQAGDVEVALDQYFPDFALDRGQPFSRSRESLNPAALLTVVRGGKAYRAFVIRSMPGIHRVEELGLSFSLLDVEPERQVEIDVHREPGALLALVAGLLIAVGLGSSLTSVRRAGWLLPREAAARPFVAGCVLGAFLLGADGGAVLHWAFSVSTAGGRVSLPGVGVVLGVALVASLGGVLLLVAQLLAGPGTDVQRPARLLLWAGASFGAVGGAFAALQLVRLVPGALPAAVVPVAGLPLAAGLVALSLRRPRSGTDEAPEGRVLGLALPVVVLATVVATIAAGVAGMQRDGTYATATVAALAATALFGLASLEPSRIATGCRLALLVSLLALTQR